MWNLLRTAWQDDFLFFEICNLLNSAPPTSGGGAVVAAGRLSCGILATSCDKREGINHVSSEI